MMENIVDEEGGDTAEIIQENYVFIAILVIHMFFRFWTKMA